MHSHDRTMLAKFGFSDPDHKNSRHDMACMYLSQIQTAIKIGRRLWPRVMPFFDRKFEGFDDKGFDINSSHIEFHLMKGQGEYKTTIGFIDVMIEFYALYIKTKKDNNIQNDARTELFSVGIEVKIEKVPVGDILRQIALYREYSNANYWIVVTDYDMTEIEVKAMKSEDIDYLRLGENFGKWIKEQSDKPIKIQDTI